MSINKKRKIAIAIIVALIVGAAVLYIFMPKISAKASSIRLIMYDYDITEDKIDIINNATESMWDQFSEISTNNKFTENMSHGKLFEAVYKIELDKITKDNDYIASASYEIDPEYEKLIFCYSTWPDTPFKTQDGFEGQYFVTLTGVSEKYSEEQLANIVEHITIHLSVQDKNNKISDFTIKFKNMTPEIVENDKEAIENSGGTIIDNLN